MWLVLLSMLLVMVISCSFLIGFLVWVFCVLCVVWKLLFLLFDRL